MGLLQPEQSCQTSKNVVHPQKNWPEVNVAAKLVCDCLHESWVNVMQDDQSLKKIEPIGRGQRIPPDLVLTTTLQSSR
eukprot:NODE_259_length_2069_cov_73.196040_g175_i0.p2 GENE.NODE_259_length_2069_cov_73.196040_g175_i0~~NODE_259_length_2069_cov_73.196040_g175_i0.p2  ORF type:complete len:78 (+),score=13.79 NODE_259_length_2069_cov_73.196040_g175_i0:1810-2043(+)